MSFYSCKKTNYQEYATQAGSGCSSLPCNKGTLRLGVFFDGTGNDDKNPIEYSNVKKLFDVYPNNIDRKAEKVPSTGQTKNFPNILSAYIRGVGSRKDTYEQWNEKRKTYAPPVKYDEDPKTDSAFGRGGHERINDMLFQLQLALKIFKEDSKENCLPKHIHFDVFGFSRGAIQARHFVNCLKQGFYELNAMYAYYQPKHFTIKTLNIFDSVSSFGAGLELLSNRGLNPGYAVSSLNIRVIAYSIVKTVDFIY